MQRRGRSGEDGQGAVGSERLGVFMGEWFGSSPLVGHPRWLGMIQHLGTGAALYMLSGAQRRRREDPALMAVRQPAQTSKRPWFFPLPRPCAEKNTRRDRRVRGVLAGVNPCLSLGPLMLCLKCGPDHDGCSAILHNVISRDGSTSIKGESGCELLGLGAVSLNSF